MHIVFTAIRINSHPSTMTVLMFLHTRSISLLRLWHRVDTETYFQGSLLLWAGWAVVCSWVSPLVSGLVHYHGRRGLGRSSPSVVFLVGCCWNRTHRRLCYSGTWPLLPLPLDDSVSWSWGIYRCEWLSNIPRRTSSNPLFEQVHPGKWSCCPVPPPWWTWLSLTGCWGVPGMITWRVKCCQITKVSSTYHFWP